MDELKLAKDSLQLVRKDLGLEEEIDLDAAADPFGRLHDYLTRQIQYLLDRDFGRLLNALYRIDLKEDKVRSILELSSPGKIASEMAGAIIQREKEKIITRTKYREEYRTKYR